MTQSHFHAEPAHSIEFVQTDEIQTIVQKATDHPMARMSEVFDSTYSALIPLLQAEGIQPIGPGFSLHHRLPTDSATFEVGLPVNTPLDSSRNTDSGVLLEPSTIPGGQIARISHIGSFDGLGEAWGAFMEAIAAAGKEPLLPFWEIYVTEPTPDIDPTTLRTDLVSLVNG